MFCGIILIIRWGSVAPTIGKGMDITEQIDESSVETPAPSFKDTVLAKNQIRLNHIGVDAPDLIGLFDDILLNSRQFRVKSSHYPSGARIELDNGEVLGSCLRAQYYSWTGEAEQVELDTSGLWKMDIGNAIHEWIATKSKEVMEVYDEYPIVYHPDFMKYPIRGRLDNLVLNHSLGNFGIEVKSAYGRGMTNKDTGIKYQGVKIPHLMQAFIYLCISRLPEEEKAKYMPIDENRPFVLPPLDYFIIFYIARDNAYRKQFYVTMMDGDEIIENAEGMYDELYTAKLRELKNVCVVTDGASLYVYENIRFRDIVKSYWMVEQFVNDGEVPSRDFTFDFKEGEDGNLYPTKQNTGWECSYCRFNQICWVRDRNI